jgi:hypothetical protein
VQQLPPDLVYIEDFITVEEEQALMQEIDAEQWSDKLHRCVMLHSKRRLWLCDACGAV